MKHFVALFLLMSFSIFSINLHSQDVVFSQFENSPLNLNSALTGNYDGKGRFYLNYRDQTATALKSARYRTGALSFDSKHGLAKNRAIGFGVTSLVDRAGETSFGTNQVHLHSSFIQRIGNVHKAHHTLLIGAGMGLARLRYDQGGVNCLDFSTGLNWKYQSNSRFAFQLGTSVLHFNRPDLSISQTGTERLLMRFNVHGNLEIPVIKRISLIPSFLFTDQGFHRLLMFGADCSYLFNPENRYNPFTRLKLGFLTRVGDNINIGRAVTAYTFRSTLESEFFLLGLSYDNLILSRNVGVELVLGYKFGVKKSNQEN